MFMTIVSGDSSPCHTYSGTRPVLNAIQLRGAVTFTTVAENLTLELPLPVSTVLVRRDWNSNTRPSVCEAYALTKCAKSYKGKCHSVWLLH